jgi:hypothetical protein
MIPIFRGLEGVVDVFCIGSDTTKDGIVGGTAYALTEEGYIYAMGNPNDYKFGSYTLTQSNDQITLEANSYYAFIAELTVPGNSGFTSSNPRNINVRRIKFLEPKPNFDPSASYTGQTTNLWNDPWGNPYKIFINVNGADKITIGDKTIAAKAAGYSLGPNGTDNGGCNVDLTCIAKDDEEKHKLHDDITSWN